MRKVNSNRYDFADAVQKYLKEYGDYTVEALTAVIPQIAKESAQKLKETSPRNTGEYAKNWKYKTEKGRLKVVSTVFNDKTYRLTHLLEKSHLMRNGRRSDASKTRHIQPVEEWATDETENRLIDYIQGFNI